MKTTNIAQAIAKAVLHAATHGVNFTDMFVVLTPQQISTLYAQHESSCDTTLPPKGCYGVASEAPADKVLITISTSIDKGNDKIDVTIGNDGCVEVPMKMTMVQLVLLLQNYGIALGEAGDKANVSLNVTRKGKQAQEAINEVKGKLDALLADMQEKQGEWFMLHMLDANQARQTLGGFIKRLQEIVS